MGAWGITERESDYGLDLLGTIVTTVEKRYKGHHQRKPANKKSSPKMDLTADYM